MDELKAKLTRMAEGAGRAISDSLGEVNEEEQENIAFILSESTSIWSIIANGKRLGYRRQVIVGAVGMTAFLAFLNILFLGIGLYRYFTIEGIAFKDIFWSFLIGAAITVYMGREGYMNILRESSRVIYLQLQGFFRKLCAHVVVFAAQQVENSKKLTENSVHKALSVKNMLQERYGSKVPRFVIKRAQKWVDKIPLAGFLNEYYTRLERGEQAAIAEELYNKVNDYLLENHFTTKSKIFYFLGLVAANIGA